MVTVRTKVPMEDRRVRKTRAALSEALTALIREKRYDAITVTEILERANVGRSTFYMHFRDKDDLLASGIRDLLEASTPAAATSAAGRPEGIIAFSRPVFEHIEHHRHGTAGRMGTRGWAVVHEHLRRVIAERIGDDVERALGSSRQRTPSIPRDLLAQCVAAAFVLTLNWWVESGSRVSADEADGHFRSLALPMLHAALGA